VRTYKEWMLTLGIDRSTLSECGYAAALQHWNDHIQISIKTNSPLNSLLRAFSFQIQLVDCTEKRLKSKDCMKH
jgi:hypothetical protein